MSVLNQSAPPAQAPASKDFIKFEVFPKSTAYVLTIVGFNYIDSYPFERDDPNPANKGKKIIVPAAALEFFFGTKVGDKAYFCKTWPQSYSLNEKSNYTKLYDAATGAPPKAGSNPNDIVGKYVMGNIKVETKKSAKGTEYQVSNLKMPVTPVPELLANAGTPLQDLQAAFEAALAGGDKKDDSAPF